MKVLVTGSGGLIGSYAVRTLHQARYEVIALYRKPPVRKEGNPWHMIYTDLLNEESEFVLKTIDADVVVHCAAVLPKQFKGEEAIQVADVNRQIDERIIKFCQDKGSTLIYSSSSSVYGSEGFPWNENSSVTPWGPYAIGKFETEQKIKKLKNRFVILRINAPYAPEQRSRTVLKIFIERAMDNRNLYYYGNGKRQQDFTAVNDVAQAIACAVSHGTAKGIFNIAGGKPVSMKTLANLVIQCVPKTASKVLPAGQPDPQEEYRAIFDISKAGNILGWAPSASLEQGIQNWIKFLEKNR